jgi:hypothetical protein
MIRNIYGEGKTVGAAVRSLKQRLNKTDNLALYDPDRAAMLNKNLNTHFL